MMFPNRELDEDRKVKVLMLGVLHGTLLDETPAAKIKNVDPKQVRANVLDTLQTLYCHNIFFPKIDLQKFLISEDDPKPKLFGFSVSFDARDYPTKEDREDHISVDTAMISRRLNKLGYIE